MAHSNRLFTYFILTCVLPLLCESSSCASDIAAMKDNDRLKREMQKMFTMVDHCDSKKEKCATAQSEGKMMNITVLGWDTVEASLVCQGLKGELCNVDIMYNISKSIITTYVNGLFFCLPTSCNTGLSSVNTTTFIDFLDRPMFDDVTEKCHMKHSECQVKFYFCDRVFSKPLNGSEIPDFNEIPLKSSSIRWKNNLAVTMVSLMLIFCFML